MSVDGWSLVRFLHVLAASLWVGGQLLLSVVILPLVRQHVAQDAREPLVRATVRRFGLLANVALLPVLLATGLGLLYHRGVTLDSFGRPGYGQLLSIKLTLVVVAVALAVLHGIVAGTRPQIARPIALAGVATSVAVVLFAVALVP